jgi:hypothetical protein
VWTAIHPNTPFSFCGLLSGATVGSLLTKNRKSLVPFFGDFEKIIKKFSIAASGSQPIIPHLLKMPIFFARIF